MMNFFAEYVAMRYFGKSTEKAQGMVEYAILLIGVIVILTTVFNQDSGMAGALQSAFKKVTTKINAI